VCTANGSPCRRFREASEQWVRTGRWRQERRRGAAQSKCRTREAKERHEGRGAPRPGSQSGERFVAIGNATPGPAGRALWFTRRIGVPRSLPGVPWLTFSCQAAKHCRAAKSTFARAFEPNPGAGGILKPCSMDLVPASARPEAPFARLEMVDGRTAVSQRRNRANVSKTDGSESSEGAASNWRP